tara:strand:- start:94 stop:507 length:414 start_codon:yes stop_codon:yes gene_type:complete
MKHLLTTTIAAVVLVGCSTTQPPEPPTAKAPDISIHEAVAIENTEAVKQHLDAGTDVNAKVGVGKTPLHNAIRLGNTEIAELLIANGADVNAKFDDGINGRTALDIATSCLWRRPETASLLRKHGAKTGEELKAEGN